MPRTYQLNIFILKSSSSLFIKNESVNIELKKRIGEGTFGVVYEINDNNVIKIFKNSIYDNTLQSETTSILPYKNENRELIFFNNIIDHEDKEDYIIKIMAIGYINKKLVDRDKFKNELTIFNVNSNFIIIPLAYQFYTVYKEISYKHDYKPNYRFIIGVMQRLAKICLHLETTYKKINLDLKLNNCVFKVLDKDINQMIMLDFSLLKSFDKESGNNPLFNRKFYDSTDYYIWPIDNNYTLANIHSYSICINGLELIFGRDEIKEELPEKKYINKCLEYIRKHDKKAYEIFNKGLTERMETNKLLELLDNFFV
jgi:serine/threonine protein kinase